MLEMLDYPIRIGSTPTFLYFDLYNGGMNGFLMMIFDRVQWTCVRARCIHQSIEQTAKKIPGFFFILFMR